MFLLVGALLAVTVLGVAILLAVSAKNSVESARERLTALRSQELPIDGGAVSVLEAAKRDVATARRQLANPVVHLVAAVPVLGRSWDAERAVVDAADEVLGAALIASRLMTEVDVVGGTVDLTGVTQIRADLAAPVARSEAALARLDIVSTNLTPAPVGRAVNDALEVLGPAASGLEQATAALAGLHGMLGGAEDRSVFVALANNAELRGSGGYVSSFATGTTSGGRLQLDPLQDLIALADPPAAANRVPAPAEYVADFGSLSADTTQFRSWNMSPDFADSAQVAASIAGRLLGEEPDVVVLIDVPALTALTALARLGGGEIPVAGGRTVSPEELQDALLIDAYAGAGADGLAQTQRRTDLQAAASTAVTQLLSADVPLAQTLRTLRDLAQGRHLVVWSAVPSEQETLEHLGVSGALGAADRSDLLHVSVNNLGADKLDVHMDREVDVEVVLAADAAQVRQRVTFTNNAPEDLVPYVAGTDTPGTAVSRVEFSLAPGARVGLVSVDGVQAPAVVRSGEARQRVALRVTVPRGEQVAVEVQYELDLQDSSYQLELVPQALATDAALDVQVRSADGRVLERQDNDDPNGSEFRVSADFDRTIRFAVAPPVVERTWRGRLSDFWNEPLQLG